MAALLMPLSQLELARDACNRQGARAFIGWLGRYRPWVPTFFLDYTNLNAYVQVNPYQGSGRASLMRRVRKAKRATCDHAQFQRASLVKACARSVVVCWVMVLLMGVSVSATPELLTATQLLTGNLAAWEAVSRFQPGWFRGFWGA